MQLKLKKGSYRSDTCRSGFLNHLQKNTLINNMASAIDIWLPKQQIQAIGGE